MTSEQPFRLLACTVGTYWPISVVLITRPLNGVITSEAADLLLVKKNITD